MPVSVYIVTQSMGPTRSKALQHIGRGHFKEKQALSLTSQIMVDDEGVDFQAIFPDIFADYQNPPLTGDVTMAKKAWDNWQHAPMGWWQSAQFRGVGGRLLAAGSLLMTISKLKTPFSQVCIASMSIIRRGVCLWS